MSLHSVFYSKQTAMTHLTIQHIPQSLGNILVCSLVCFTCSLPLILQGQCQDNTQSPFPEHGWLSCTTQNSPNPDRGVGHWILYDFGEMYALDSLYYWNYNAWGETGYGVKDVVLDYSLDQNNWTEIDTFTFERAPGSWKYQGRQGPSLKNTHARYLLMTVLSAWDEFSSCAGLSEIKITLGEVTATGEVPPGLDFIISPNPAAGSVTVRLNSLRDIDAVSLYTSTGQLLQSKSNLLTPVVRFDVSELPEGPYFITIFFDQKVVSKMILVARP